ncbi:MAG: ABC-2 type transport system ATP-binding protein [Saprospiraceae bacterium]|jgi:ABC-2 type transport system ATP-binding protein
MSILKISNLSKTYENGVKALDDVSLEIPVGMFGLLGPNGAGKSTLMRTIATLQSADAGSITLGGIDVLSQHMEVRRVLGYLPQEFGLYPRVSAVELLNHIAILKGVTDTKERKDTIDALLQRTNLYEHRKRKLGGYSGGMKRRFGIAQALLANPKLIIVDEPTAGLDPIERNRFHNLLCELGENTVVILSTHIVEDVKELCTNMAIINKGKVLVQEDPMVSIRNLEGKVYRKTIAKSELATYKLSHQVIAQRLVQGRQVIHVLAAGSPGEGFDQVSPDLSDVYFSNILSDESN